MRRLPLTWPCVLFATLLLRVAPAAAGGAEYRTIQLSDGRTLHAVVLESTAEGMRVRTPQGLTVVPYQSLAGIQQIDAAAYDAQPPLALAVAPVGGSGADGTRIGSQVATWLGMAIVVPATGITTPEQWMGKLPDGGAALSACQGEPQCVVGQAASLDADVLLLPQVLPGAGTHYRLGLVAIVRPTGAVVGSGFADLIVEGGGGSSTVVRDLSAVEVAAAAFRALALEPEIGIPAAVAAALPPAPEPVAAGAGPRAGDGGDGAGAAGGTAGGAGDGGTAGDGVAAGGAGSGATAVDGSGTAAGGTGPSADGAGTTTGGAVSVGTGPGPAGAGTAARPELGGAIALGFLPVPGLAPATLRDPVGFGVALGGTLALGGVSIYVTGRLARTKDAFWTPVFLVPYAINVLLNEVCVVGAWRRLQARTSAVASLPERPRHAFSLAVTPVLASKERQTRPDGVSLVVGLSF